MECQNAKPSRLKGLGVRIKGYACRVTTRRNGTMQRNPMHSDNAKHYYAKSAYGRSKTSSLLHASMPELSKAQISRVVRKGD